MANSTTARALRAAGATMLAGGVACLGYDVSWWLWRWSAAPGIIIIFGGWPWSFLWLFHLRPIVKGWLGWPLFRFLEPVVLGLGFSINCALACFVAVMAWKLTRSKT